jgi:hypothetical protein
MARLLEELFDLYESGEAALAGGPGPSAMREAAALEMAALASPRHRDFWERAIQGAAPDTLPRWPASPGPAAHNPRFPLPDEIDRGLQALARSVGVPLRSVLLAAHARLLSVLTGQTEVVTGVVTSLRPETADGERALGLFLTTLPLRLRLAGDARSELGLTFYLLTGPLAPTILPPPATQADGRFRMRRSQEARAP